MCVYVQLEARKQKKTGSVDQFLVARMTSTKEFRSCCYVHGELQAGADLFENMHECT